MKIDNGDYPTGKDSVDPKKVKRLKILSKLATFTCIAILNYSYLQKKSSVFMFFKN